jgi:environmental stress-induced protein Ves
MDPRPRLIRKVDLVPVPWRNGQGVTRDLAAVHGADGALRWQVSIADLDRDTGFSDYSGYDRVFTPIAGTIALAFEDGLFENCPLLVPVPFAGERQTRCRVDAPGRAFNVLVDRRYHRGEATILRLQPGDAATPPSAGLSVLHVLSGKVQVGTLPAGEWLLAAGDSAQDPGTVVAAEACVILQAWIS